MNKMKSLIFIIILNVIFSVKCWDEGSYQIDTPPMGWISWGRFKCNTDCTNFPDECISEKLIQDMADIMYESGYGLAGYKFVILDDCWLAPERDENGRLQADPERFPNGIRNLSYYVQDRGLRFGISQNIGEYTCAGNQPGMLNHFKIDAETFSEWRVDYVKINACGTSIEDLEKNYREFGEYLKTLPFPIIYSCTWPSYLELSGIQPNYSAISEVCNVWRNYKSIADSWDSLVEIINFYGENRDRFAPFTRATRWNDPDALMVGNFGLSLEQSKVQMALWAILSAPLLMSVDLRTIRPDVKDILLNRRLLEISQDSLAIQGKRVSSIDDIDIFTKPINPIIGGHTSFAVAIVNKRMGLPRLVQINTTDIGLTHGAGYQIENVYDLKIPDYVGYDDTFTVKVNPTGVVLIKAEVSYYP